MSPQTLEGSAVVAVVARSEAAARQAILEEHVLEAVNTGETTVGPWRHVVPGEPVFDHDRFSGIVVATDLEPEQGAGGLSPGELSRWWAEALLPRLLPERALVGGPLPPNPWGV